MPNDPLLYVLADPDSIDIHDWSLLVCCTAARTVTVTAILVESLRDGIYGLPGLLDGDI
jgi:hypothetical protein